MNHIRHRIENRDYKDIVEVSQYAHSSLDTDRTRQHLLCILERVFEAEGGVFLLANRELEKLAVDNIASLHVSENEVTRYAQYYWRYDPIYQAALRLKKVAFKNSDILPYSEWMKLEYYNDFLRPMNIYRELVICPRLGTRILGQISLFRPRSRLNFNERDILKANIIASSIAIALRNAILFSKAEMERDLLSDLNEFLLEGIIILDHELCPVYISPKAKEMLSYLLPKHSGRIGEVGRGNWSIPSAVLEDCSVLKRASGRAAYFQREITIDEKQNKVLHIGISRFPMRCEVPCEPYFLVSVRSVSRTCDSVEELTERECHLTKREVDIAMCVRDGLTNRQISQKLSISEFTVGTHLKNIFEKTGIRNRTELATYITSCGVSTIVTERFPFVILRT